ncbi:hypothetical protein BJY14_006046 [Actinomadura luteofluorescens]|uniref:Uncharacterized protein n=2 Tax=Actinomadura luteofluorescens TaxID=46163 RepID=A0A7Y9JIX1_9ACTN|nr:hypothetical protein [Actinomadura luteofluorescens]NYD50063.1 hypothetical protein [Actinomadura luteofluorescens]
MGFEWRRPLSRFDPGWWGGLGDRRTVLVVVGSPELGQPVLDTARLASTDPRLRVLLTTLPGPSDAAVDALLRDAGTVPLSWREARSGDFALVVAAGLAPGRWPSAPLIVFPWKGMERAVHLAGRKIHGGPVVLACAHEVDRPLLHETGATTEAVVVGDSVHDRIVASLPFRDFYRRALGVGRHRRLVVVALPAAGAANRCGGLRRGSGTLAHRLLTELPPEGFQVLGLHEPGTLPSPSSPSAADLRNGLGLLPLEADWRAALVAADWIIGAPGAVTRYGTITGVPVMLTDAPPRATGISSAAASYGVRLVAHRPVLEQLTEAVAQWRPDHAQTVVRGITSEPGRFDRAVRRTMYRLLRLPQPATIPVAEPVSPPFRIECPADRPIDV